MAQTVKNPPGNAGDLGLIPGSGKSPGEWNGNPFQYSWVSFVDQLVKNPPAMQETWVWSLGQEDPAEKGKATHSSIQAWRIPWTVWSMGLQRVGHDWANVALLVHEECKTDYNKDHCVGLALLKYPLNWKNTLLHDFFLFSFFIIV